MGASRKQSSDDIVSPTAMSKENVKPSTAQAPAMPTSSYWSGRGFGFSANADNAYFGTLGAGLHPGAASFEPGKEYSSRMKVLALGTEPDEPTIVSSNPVLPKASQNPIGTQSASSSPIHPKAWFSTDLDGHKPFTGTHFLLIQGLKENELGQGILKVIEDMYPGEVCGKKFVKAAGDSEYTDVVLFVNDMRTSIKIYQDLEGEGLLTVRHVSFDWYNNGANAIASSVDPKTTYVGQISFTAEFKGRTTDFDNTVNVYEQVSDIAGQFGEISAFEQNKSAQYPTWKFRVEFFKSSSADRAIAKAADGLKSKDFEGWVVFAAQYVPETHGSTTAIRQPSEVNAVQAVADVSAAAKIYMSPTGRTAWYTDENGVDHAVPPPRPVANIDRTLLENYPVLEANPSRNGKQVEYAAPYSPTPNAQRSLTLSGQGHMSIDSLWEEPISGNELASYRGDSTGTSQDIVLSRIYDGLDVRTTVMLRNVPHHWKWRQVKEVLDRACEQRYNFMYLRMDFSSGTNVGYCFVNFEAPIDICDLVTNLVGLAWEPGNNSRGKPKLIQVSYATIQGLESLIDKFRNSSVMDELPDYRPCLFQTAAEKSKDETLAAQLRIQGLPAQKVCELGEKKPFPEVNNPSKKQRSTANAGQIGLFGPRVTRTNTERHRRSQYDRGTTAHFLEEQHSPFIPPYGSPFAGPSNAVTPMLSPQMGGFFSGPVRYGAVYPPSFVPGYTPGPTPFQPMTRPGYMPNHAARPYAHGPGMISAPPAGLGITCGPLSPTADSSDWQIVPRPDSMGNGHGHMGNGNGFGR